MDRVWYKGAAAPLVLIFRERAENKTRSQTSGRQHSNVEWVERDDKQGNK